MSLELIPAILLGAVVVTAALVFLLIHLMRKKNWLPAGKDDYDERQQREQARGYRVAYVATVIGLFIVLLVMDLVPRLDQRTTFLLLCIVLFGSILTFAIYTITHNAFMGLHDKRKGYTVFYLIVILAQVPSLMAYLDEFPGKNFWEIMKDNPAVVLNLMVVVCFTVILAVLWIHTLREEREADDEES